MVIGAAVSIALLNGVFQPILMLLAHRYIGLSEEQRTIGGAAPHPLRYTDRRLITRRTRAA